MIGMDVHSGKALGGIAHLRQSLRDILTTPLGSRVMRRDYGSRLYQLVDAPMNDDTVAEIRLATVEAVARWEPRVQVTLILVEAATAEGRFSITLEGVVVETMQAVTVEGVAVS